MARRDKPKTPSAPQPVLRANTEVGPITKFEMARFPALFLCVCFFIITTVSISAAIQFRNDMSKGALREATGSIFWVAITVTLFLSYARQKKRAESPDGDS